MPASDDTHAQYGSQPTGTPSAAPEPQSAPPMAGAPYPPTPVAGVPPAYAYGPPPQQGVPVNAAPARSGRAWLWWLLGIVVVLGLCAGTTAIIASLGNGGGSALPVGGNTIAVIPVDGAIAGTASGPTDITPENFLKLLERAQDDESVKAIVLRVNSPGGTVAASEEIATYVKQATKPVVVSVGDEDASGAYMISSQADSIVANPGSAVGSIGVIMEIPNASGLLDKIGLSFKVIHAGVYKDAGSPFRALTTTETAMLQDQIDQVYGQFIDIVASGRKLPRSQVASMATGWAWNGDEAKKLGLVDQIGTYRDALKTAARLGHISGPYQTDVYNDTTSLNGLLSTLLGIESQLQALSAKAPSYPASVGTPTLAK